MNPKNKKLLLSLQFIPFVLTNGMNLFPIFIFANLFLKYRDITQYVLPLILYYSFKTTILFLLRLKPFKINHLLQLSIIIGILGSILGSMYEWNFYFGLLSGALLGICSGLLYPSFLTVQFHEKNMNDFGITPKDQIYSLGFATIFTLILFTLVKWSIPTTFIFLGINLVLLFIIISVYPHYQIEEMISYPDYPVFETVFLFLTGFFTIFIIKIDKKLGVSGSLSIFFISLAILIGIYIVYLLKRKPIRRVSPLLTGIIIFKGMVTNFILVFCTFDQLIREGNAALYKIYTLYLLGIIISPIVYSTLTKKVSKLKMPYLIMSGLLCGFILILLPSVFYLGIFMISLFISQINQRLNQFVYFHSELPQDHRLVSKYRLNNVGSILHQIIMTLVMYVTTLLFKTVSLDEILKSYSYKIVDPSAFYTLEVTKHILVLFFIIYLSVITKLYKNSKLYKAI